MLKLRRIKNLFNINHAPTTLYYFAPNFDPIFSRDVSPFKYGMIDLNMHARSPILNKPIHVITPNASIYSTEQNSPSVIAKYGIDFCDPEDGFTFAKIFAIVKATVPVSAPRGSGG